VQLTMKLKYRLGYLQQTHRKVGLMAENCIYKYNLLTDKWPDRH